MRREWGRLNVVTTVLAFELRHLDFFRHSTFVHRHSARVYTESMRFNGRHRSRPSKISGHPSRHRFAHLAVSRRLGFTFVMHVRTAQKRHSVENVFLEPFQPEVNNRRHKKRNHL